MKKALISVTMVLAFLSITLPVGGLNLVHPSNHGVFSHLG
jgi:hypothetical protein